MQKQAYAMPSHAVDALWHVMLEYPDQYQKIMHSDYWPRVESSSLW
jgi:hypothetical protein